MKTRIAVDRDQDIVAARREGRKLAAQLGLSATDATLVATAVSELARNILLYARSGEIVLGVEHGQAPSFVIEARDRGPGIPDPERAMLDGYSTSGGLGMGLPGTRRIMDEMRIISRPDEGTTVIAKKRLSNGAAGRSAAAFQMPARTDKPGRQTRDKPGDDKPGENPVTTNPVTDGTFSMQDKHRTRANWGRSGLSPAGVPFEGCDQ